MTSKRFIEESFPVKEVGIESAKEKNIRHGHISTLHIWWSRKPLAISRAMTYASLISAPKNIDEWHEKRNFIINLSKWENANNKYNIKKAQEDIIKAYQGNAPKVIDPFAGGGSHPLEALRLGCKTYSNDYNPIAVIMELATLVYPVKYGNTSSEVPDLSKIHNENKGDRTYFSDEYNISKNNPLLFAVKYWGDWVLGEAKKELIEFYKTDNNETVVGYYWMRTVPCCNPLCGVEIPLTANWWLAKKDRKKISLYPVVDKERNTIEFGIVEKDKEGWRFIEKPDILNLDLPVGSFDPEKGTVARAVVSCPACGAVIDDKTTRQLFQEGKSSQRMIAVVYLAGEENRTLGKGGTERGKRYRIATEEDMELYLCAEKALSRKVEELREKWGIEPVPDEELLYKCADQLPKYGIPRYGDLFNSRQKLSLITFCDAVRRAYEEMIQLQYPPDFAKAVVSYLALNVNRLVDKGATLCIWSVSDEYLAHVFGRQALPMTWDFFEFNPFSEVTGDWKTALEYINRSLLNISQISDFQTVVPVVSHASATQLPYPDNYFDAVLTDPPYYDNISYAALSDFFYVWLKRSIGHLYPELFITPLTPKKGEIIANVPLHKDKEKAKRFFEEQLGLSFKEMYRILKPDGIAVIVYAHKSTSGWETVINALLDSGLVVTASWPVNTEMQSRLNANETASLASSIYIVGRKMKREETGFYNEVLEELKRYLNQKLERLWDEGVSGSDFFISAIGAGIEVFGKYEKVMNYEGEVIRADVMLEEIRKIATDYAVRKILHNGFAGEISELTRFYVLYRWEYGEARVEFDEARKLATSCGIDLTEEWSKRGSFIRKDKEYVRVLGPAEREGEELKGGKDLIDVLHRVLLLWEKSKQEELLKLLKETGYGKSDAFYRVGQAVAECLPNESKEKKLLEGFLTGKERVLREIDKLATKPEQRELF
ncbi:MAG TPA: DUF1156 domain-containing protein [Candidatus Hydrogenedens sp.]|nr:DUF1156 domain-containing protein [Candidatus Hydrogenedens sp.]